jgi:lysyl-tRNA synthetase class 2
METLLRGRVIDLRVEGDFLRVIVMVGARPREFVMHGSVCRVGDIVSFGVNGEVMKNVVVHGGAIGEWDASGDPMRWRALGSSGRSRMEMLFARAEILRAVREYFYREGFLELQAPLLIRRTCPDAFLDSFAVGEEFLTTSTEYQIKRMWTGGFDRVYSLTQNFRNEPADATHNPEFTMLEWGRTFVDLDVIERDVERFVGMAFAAVSGEDETSVVVNGYTVRVIGAPWRRMSLREALREFAEVEVDAEFSFVSLQTGVRMAGISVPAAIFEDQSLLVTFLIDYIQPKLGTVVPVFVRDWPSFQTSSAAVVEGVAVTSRCELFIGGIEIANGFPAMRDYRAQIAGFEAQNERRRREGKVEIAVDERYLEALRLGLPSAAGMALGFDRLCMVLLGARHIREVMGFAWDER